MLNDDFEIPKPEDDLALDVIFEKLYALQEADAQIIATRKELEDRVIYIYRQTQEDQFKFKGNYAHSYIYLNYVSMTDEYKIHSYNTM